MAAVVTNFPIPTPSNSSTSDLNSSSDNNSCPTSTSSSTAINTLHPLENEWAFWYDKRPLAAKRARGEKDAYESNLRPLGSFRTVEDFWRYYNHMVKPSKMDNNSNYHLFKHGIKPMWEDSANSKGGKWIISMKGGEKTNLDTYWENICLAMVGETLDIGDEITGGVVSRRKTGDRIAIWTRNRDDEEGIMTIGRHIRKIAGIPSNLPLQYQSHEDSLRTGASYTNPNKYTI